MALYIHELADWPVFTWNSTALARQLAATHHRQGRLIGQFESLGFAMRQHAELEALTEEIGKSSEIEGELLDREQVRSSVARRLGVNIGALRQTDRNVEGLVETMLDATGNCDTPLTVERLHRWHRALFPEERDTLRPVASGTWREDLHGPMQVVSGRIGHTRVHFEAPAAHRLDGEIAAFLGWFNGVNAVDPILKAGLAHLWFVTIHPFDDGNGRIARAIADMALARADNAQQRFYSMSAQIRIERKAYYDVLEHTQKGTLDVTAWLAWFLGCLDRAFDGPEGVLQNALGSARFWGAHAAESFNDRQRLLINRLLTGFTGKLTTSKWAKVAKCSQDTAYRDILDLVARGVLQREPAGGRSTAYTLASDPAASHP
jgi:Fic family protein